LKDSALRLELQGVLLAHGSLGEVLLHIESSRHSETTAAVVQGNLVTAQGVERPWCHPHDAGFTGVQNAGVAGYGRFPPRFQRKAWEAQQCVARSKSL
jgi:hypothetical protein